MYKLRVWLVAVIITAGSAGTALAADQSMLSSGQPVSSDYFAANGSVVGSGVVNGDAYVTGGTVTVSGAVKGDLLIAGGTVTVSGTVDGSIRAVGGTLILSSTVGRNVTVAGGTVSLEAGSKVAGNVLIAGGSASASGTIGGDLGVAAGTMSLAGTVNGHVKAQVGQLTVLNTAVVGSGLQYISKADAVIGSGAKITGNVSHQQPPARDHSQMIFFGKSFLLWQLAASLLLGFVFLLLFPRFAKQAVERTSSHFWKTLGTGTVFVIVTPIIAFALVFTVIGIPLGAIVLGLYALGLVLSEVVVALWTAHLITRQFNLKLGIKTAYLVGALVYWLICAIPYIGGIIALLGALLGFGGLLLQAKTLSQQLPADEEVS